MNKLLAVIAALAMSQTAIAQTACDLGVYSKYIAGIGGVADDHPVVQGQCTKTFANGTYVNGWFSESLRDPGLSKTYGNEIDLTLGWTGDISDKWSVDVHTAYYDMANPRLLKGTNGDLTDIGGSLHYRVSKATSIYANVEYYYGLGQNGFPNGGKAGVGVRTSFADMVNVDAAVYRNNHFLGSGEFLKLSIEPSAPVWKFAGGQVRPNISVWKPLGKYNEDFDPQVMVSLRIDW